MRYYILFSVVSFCLLQLGLCDTTKNPATPNVLRIAKQFHDTYTYSLIPPDGDSPASMVIWWTPDITNSQIKFGIMGGESSYVGFGFNPTDPMMVNSYAVISGDTQVQLYQLGYYVVGTPESDQSNIKDITLQEVDNYIFSEFTWVLKPPFYWNITSTPNFVWSTHQTVQGDPFLSPHDNKGAFTFNFTMSASSQGHKEVVFINCNHGVSATSFFSFIGTTGCSCAPSFTPNTNCSASTFPFNHVFLAKDGSPIATMYWSVNGSSGNFQVVSVPFITGWTGIAFSTEAGTMGPADAVVYPAKDGAVMPFYLQTEGIVHDAQINITVNSAISLNGVNYFSFTRDLSHAGSIAITDYTSVPMIAATSPKTWPLAHPSTSCSYGSDIINLLNGEEKPSPFVWTKFTTHGLLMWLSWGVIIPCGFLWARFVKGYPNDKSALWFEGHRTLMSIGFILVIVSAIWVVGLAGTHLDSTHKILGATVVACALYQVMSAVMRPHADPTNPSPQRLVFEYTHHFVGRSTIIIAWVTICYGLMLVHGISMSVVWGHVALSVIWLVAALVLEIRKAIITRRNREYESLNRR